MLCPELQLPGYQVGDDWWKGPYTQARTVDYASGEEAEQEAADQDFEVIREAQRLMAFLTNTTRAYGSVGNLLELNAMKECWLEGVNNDDELVKFLVNWGAAYENQTSRSLKGVLKSVVNAAGKTEESFLLDIKLTDYDPLKERTLYDALDDALLRSQGGRAHITDLSNVLVLRLESTNDRELDCKIPATLYADRYLEDNKKAVDEMLCEMNQHIQHMTKLDDELWRIKYHTLKRGDGAGRRVEALALLETSMRAFQPHESAFEQLRTTYMSIEGKLQGM